MCAPDVRLSWHPVAMHFGRSFRQGSRHSKTTKFQVVSGFQKNFQVCLRFCGLQLPSGEVFTKNESLLSSTSPQSKTSPSGHSSSHVQFLHKIGKGCCQGFNLSPWLSPSIFHDKTNLGAGVGNRSTGVPPCDQHLGNRVGTPTLTWSSIPETMWSQLNDLFWLFKNKINLSICYQRLIHPVAIQFFSNCKVFVVLLFLKFTHRCLYLSL